MQVGMFQGPYMAPDRTMREAFEWCVDQAVWADEIGFSEYWVAEHATVSWEPVPNPEMVISAVALKTKNIILGPLAHLLPYHNPATLAVQASWLSHILQGRYILGIASGAYPNDAILRGMADMSTNHEMMLEALYIMELVWKSEPFHFKGKFWSAGYPEIVEGDLEPMRDLRPYGGKIPIAMTGLSAPSSSLNFAASKGYIPSSLFIDDATLRAHIDDYARAAEQHGFTANPMDHRVLRDIVVADSDEEAYRIATEGGLARTWTEYLLPVFERFGVLDKILPDSSMSTSDITIDMLAKHNWIVGSPETVREKLEHSQDS